MIPPSHLSLPFLAGRDLPQFPFQKVTAMPPISFYQPLFAQPDVTHAIVDALMQWRIYGALFFVLVGIRMYSGHSRFSSPFAALTALAFLLSVSASLPFAFVVIGLIATCCALLAETTGALLVGSVGAGLDAWRRLNAKKLADEATPSSRQS